MSEKFDRQSSFGWLINKKMLSSLEPEEQREIIRLLQKMVAAI
ncbi:hypothetical protein [Vibrio sp. Isolate25]|nr:hypothetical protein [Vibrio sp. Isolate25]